MIGKNIKIKKPDGTEEDYKEIRYLLYFFEKLDTKIIKYNEGQIRGNYLQIQFLFENDQNYVFVSDKPPSQPNTAMVGIPATYKGKSPSFSVDQLDKSAWVQIHSSKDGNKFDKVYNGTGLKASEIHILDSTTPPEKEYQLPITVVIKDSWGGNDDRMTWSPVQMEDDDKRGLWKVVDNNKKNIAAEFSSQQEAQQFIDHLRKNPQLKPNGLQRVGGQEVPGQQPQPGARPYPFPSNPTEITFNQTIVDGPRSSEGGRRKEIDIRSGRAGDGARAEGTCVFYVRHNNRIGRDQYSVKWGYGVQGRGGEYEHITQLGGTGNPAGLRWESNHNNYDDSRLPTNFQDLNEEMKRRVRNGLTAGFENRQQGFMLIKTRSPNNNATIYDVYVDDMDGQGWKYAFSNKFDDSDTNQLGRRNYNDRDMRIEVRFQDQNGDLNWPAANYRSGRPQGYISPLFPNT